MTTAEHVSHSNRQRAIRRRDVRTQARQVSLVRLLLITMGFGVLMILSQGRQPELIEPAGTYLKNLLIVTTIIAVALFSTVWLARWRWQLALHLVFDLVWIGLLLFYSGGVASPGIVLLFVVVLVGTLVLPGVVPFVLPALSSLVLAIVASLYLAGQAPFTPEFVDANAGLTQTNRILGVLATQVAALFMVDLLGQLLARRQQEQRIFTGEVLDRLGEGVLAIDRNGLVAYVNREAIRLLNISIPVEGMHIQQIFTNPAIKPVLDLVTGQKCPALERFSTADGKQLVLRVTELLDRKDQPLGRTLIIADETRLRVLEDSAHRSEHLAALGEMAAGIAHEVRNPLTSLRGCAQELSDMARQTEQNDAVTLAQIIVTESDRLARIVEDFLALSRLRKPEVSSLDPATVLLDVERLVRQRRDLPESLRFEVSISETTQQIMADEGQLRQVLLNLINNAIDAVRSSSSPVVTCTLEKEDMAPGLNGPGMIFKISDNGIGIPPEQYERIFTPFFSTKAQGTGLGLAIVQRIIREHDGFITVNSEVGKGTTFSITLPSHSHTRVLKRALGAD